MAMRKKKRLFANMILALPTGRHPDGDGLYLDVDASGARRWFLRTVIQGMRRDIGLGAFSSLNGLSVARKAAEELRLIARGVGDPLAARRKNNEVPTFERAAEAVHRENLPSWRNEKHRQQWINTLKEHAFPAIGTRRVNSIETSDVLRVLGPVWLTKPETARRLRQRIKAVLDWAKAAGHRTGENPVEGVTRGLPKQPVGKRHHKALPYTEVPAFVTALRNTGASDSTKRAFEFLILSACRVGEVVDMKKAEVDVAQLLWTVPAERMKASKVHRVPLTKRMVDLLEEAIAQSDSNYVFAGMKKGKPMSKETFLMLLERMKVDSTAHGFRSSFRDWAAEMTNYPREVVELALAHVNKDKTEAAYLRTDLFLKRRRLMEEWSSFVATDPGFHARVVTSFRTAEVQAA